LGLVSAVCTDYTYTEGTDDGLMARLDLTFVESGLPVFPGVADAVLSAVQTASETLEAAAAVDFADVLEVIGKPGKVLTRAIANVTATVTNATGLQRLVDATAALLAVPEDFVAQWSGIIDAITDRATAQALAESMALSATVDTTSTPTEQTIATNEIALYALPRRLALARACELVASEEIEVYDDARAVRAALLGLIDAELAVAPLLDDDLTQALQDLRVQTAKAIDAVAGAAVRLRTFTPPDVLPACVLAVQLYGDATRADELVARNNIAHPGFVLVGPLRVLAS
jgi:prophage DNA circulation protein